MKQVPPILRHLALSTAACFAWSFVAAPATMAATYHAPVNPGRTRVLSATELAHMVGSVTPIAISSTGVLPAAASGTSYSWEASVVGGVKTGNGNKLTTVPIVKWTARGGLPVEYTLYHNSEGIRNRAGYKWTSSTDMQSSVDGSGNVTLYWPDGRVVFYTKNIDSSYSAPTGIHDKLTSNIVSGTITSYDVKTKNQVKYRLTSVTSTSYTLTSISDLNGNTITINRDGAGLATSIVDPTGRTITITNGVISGSSFPTLITDPQGRQFWPQYTVGKQMFRIVWPGNSTENFGYDANNNITSDTDRRGNATTATYNADGSIATLTDPCGNSMIFGYTSSATTVTDPNSHQTVYTYNASDQLWLVTDAQGYSESYTYDGANNILHQQSRRGYDSPYSYDAMGNVVTSADPFGHTTTYTYNAFNQVTSVTYPMGESTVSTYDSGGNQLTRQDKDSSGTVVPNSEITYTFDAHGLVTSKFDDHLVNYAYDTDGNLITLTTAAPLNHATHWTYNPLGVVLTRTDAKSQTTTYTLDAWNRVTTITYPSGSRTYTYDNNNNLTQFTDPTGTTTRTYDADNRLLTEAKGSVTLLTHQYDATGQDGLLSCVFDGDTSARRFNYSYTVRNQISKVAEGTSISSPGTTYTYDPNGNETGATNANGTVSRRVYDAANRVTQRASSQSWGNDFSWFNYSYNNDSLVSSGTDDGGTFTYTYDDQRHLASEVRTGTGAYNKAYYLTRTGQRWTQVVNTIATSYSSDTDGELVSSGPGGGVVANSYTYDANGNQITRSVGGVSYTLGYDYENELTSVTGGGHTSTYTYDALGRRVTATVDGNTTITRYDGTHALRDSYMTYGGVVLAAYLYGNELISRDNYTGGGGHEWMAYDKQGNQRSSSDTAQNALGHKIYDAFGLVASSSGTTSSPFLYGASNGYRTDATSGLVLVGARYYDPQVGRFITRDTDLSQAPYVYCNADPVNNTDPSGHSWFSSIFGAVSKAVTSIVSAAFKQAPLAMLGLFLGATPLIMMALNAPAFIAAAQGVVNIGTAVVQSVGPLALSVGRTAYSLAPELAAFGVPGASTVASIYFGDTIMHQF